MKVYGRMTCNMEKEWKLGQMGADMKEIMGLEESMELVPINGVMDHNIQENGRKTRYLELAYIPGSMEENMKENGKITIWKVLEYMFGTMEESMKDNTKMTRNMDSVAILGLMADFMKDVGGKENNMVWAHIQFLKITRLNMVFGKMERELNGSVKKKLPR